MILYQFVLPLLAVKLRTIYGVGAANIRNVHAKTREGQGGSFCAGISPSLLWLDNARYRKLWLAFFTADMMTLLTQAVVQVGEQCFFQFLNIL